MIRHVVADGQTPAELAERYGVSFDELVRLNGLEPDQPVPPGVMLWVPETGVSGRGKADPARKKPTLCVPPDLFAALDGCRDEAGTVVLRIIRARPGEPLSLVLP
ncbi:MAG: LysM domain-containing protein [Bacillota bacterium]|nr:LysM domain-containing protein [Bacillota bacterium]